MADTAYGSRTLTAMFDTEAEADRAVSRLRDAGVADNSINVTRGASGASNTGDASGTGYATSAGSDVAAGTYDTRSGLGTSGTTGGSDYGGTTSTSGYSEQHKGFWESLGDFFFPDEDRYAYAEGLSRGGILVTVSNIEDSQYDTVVDILDDEGSVDVDSRQEEWRSSGWTDYRGSEYYNEDEYNRGRSGLTGAVTGAVGGAAAAVGDALTGDRTRGTVYDDGMRGSGAVGTGTDVRSDAYGSAGDVGVGRQTTRADDLADSDAGMGTTGTTGGMGTTGTSDYASGARDVSGDETVKVVEEQLAVGKRDVEQGRVRVRSYVREQPVEANVQLRSTRVHVERRPVDRAANPGDVQFQDRTIEAREHAEQAVVQKEARVVEEIGLRQETDTRTETVSDTVRKTEVEIEDERTGEVTRVTGDDATGTTTGSGTSSDRDRY